MHKQFWSERLKGGDHLEDLGIDGRHNIKMDLREVGWESVDWIHLAQDGQHCRALVNMAINFLFP